MAGLRDYLGSDYYIPLFAGVRSASTAPAGTYSPGTQQPGSGLGSLGNGDGGWDTPDDSHINTPLITSPDEDEVIVPSGHTATSTAFSSTNGQTHAASRWWIMTQGGGTLVWDSGVTTSNKVAKPMASLGLQPGGLYKIAIRHKGSGGGWSQVSPYVNFEVADCGVDGNTYKIGDGTAEETGTHGNYESAVDEAIEKVGLSFGDAGWTEDTAHGYPTLDEDGQPETTRFTVTGNGYTASTATGEGTCCEVGPYPSPGAACHGWIAAANANDPDNERTFYQLTQIPMSDNWTCEFTGPAWGGPVPVSVTMTSGAVMVSPAYDVLVTPVDGAACTDMPEDAPEGTPPTPPDVPEPTFEDGHAQVTLDMQNSHLLGSGSDFTSLRDIVTVNGVLRLGYAAVLVLTFQNTSTNASGVAHVAVSGNSSHFAASPSTVQTVTVPAGGIATLNFTLSTPDETIGTYTVTIDVGDDTPIEFPLAFTV